VVARVSEAGEPQIRKMQNHFHSGTNASRSTGLAGLGRGASGAARRQFPANPRSTNTKKHVRNSMA
jgi:hypothetical protein